LLSFQNCFHSSTLASSSTTPHSAVTLP
jgi:hypothetical protein